MTKNILSLSSVDAKKFFLKQESYSNIDLPPYFAFSKTLLDIDKQFKKGVLDMNDLNEAKKNETVNHILYGNKDGKYAWRKYEIINPLIYVSLVNIITEKNNWKFLQNRFKEFKKNSYVECESIPVLPHNKFKQKASQISQWINGIEKKSIPISLEYKFLYQTDITDCYGSIYTHSLPWAIHTKEISKEKRQYNQLFGNKIDNHIQAMSYGQTNGIPQGSILMDFIAEIVLGFADIQLSKKLNKYFENKNKFHILRYRDDYRIFVNDISDGDVILKCLSEVLIDLGFKLNTSKTFLCDDVIGGSIKKDKIYALNIEYIPKNLSKKDLVKHLLITQQIGRQFPNSGTVNIRLSQILDVVKIACFNKQEKLVVGLLVDIAYNSPNSFPVVAGLISRCIFKLTKNKKEELLNKVQQKICKLSNIGLLEIWTQRISIRLSFKLQLHEKLCKNVYGANEKIFETNWINILKIRTLIDNNSYINKKTIRYIKPVINAFEVQTFDTYEH